MRTPREIAHELGARILGAAPEPLDSIPKMEAAIAAAIENARAEGAAVALVECCTSVVMRRDIDGTMQATAASLGVTEVAIAYVLLGLPEIEAA